METGVILSGKNDGVASVWVCQSQECRMGMAQRERPTTGDDGGLTRTSS